MSDTFVGETRYIAGTAIPEGWLKCDGAILPVKNYQALFMVIGWKYGGTPGSGDNTTFALPNLMQTPEARSGMTPIISYWGAIPQPG
jgi:microcystin-dependent protein